MYLKDFLKNNNSILI